MLEELTRREAGVLNRLMQALSEDLLHPDEVAKPRVLNVSGHCYVLSEAFIHALGGKNTGYRPCRYRLSPASVHWWVVTPDGRILDATAGQFRDPVPYQDGRRTWFLTAEPSRRARILLERAGFTQ